MSKTYIDRDAVLQKRLLWIENNKRSVPVVMVEDIETIPAADVVEVVRCRDCIHYEMGVCLKIYDDGAANKDAWQERNPSDYCSYGQSKGGDGR